MDPTRHRPCDGDHLMQTPGNVMRILILIVACVGCEHGSTPPGEDPACGSLACDAGELCRHQAQGIDGGVPNPPECIALPAGCSALDCSGAECPQCILDLCLDENLSVFVELAARVLSCPAQ